MSKSVFGLLLVALGLCGTWFLITGQLSGIIKKLQMVGATGTTTSSSSPLAANQTGGKSAPLAYNELNLGSPLLAYGVTVGDNGAHIEPVSSSTTSS